MRTPIDRGSHPAGLGLQFRPKQGPFMIKVGIVGGTGYTGVELLRLLAQHPQVKLQAITSRKEAGLPVADMYPVCVAMWTWLS